jgi:hypothetical protein
MNDQDRLRAVALQIVATLMGASTSTCSRCGVARSTDESGYGPHHVERSRAEAADADAVEQNARVSADRGTAASFIGKSMSADAKTLFRLLRYPFANHRRRDQAQNERCKREGNPSPAWAID